MLQVLPSYQTLPIPTCAFTVEHGLGGALVFGLRDAAAEFV